MMKFSVAVAAVVVAGSLCGIAQQNKYKVKSTPTDKAPKSTVTVPPRQTAPAGSGSAAKDLQNLERQTAKSSNPHATTTKKTVSTTPIKPIKDKPNPPINFSGNGGSKQAGTVSQPADPLKGRLKEKRSHP